MGLGKVGQSFRTARLTSLPFSQGRLFDGQSPQVRLDGSSRYGRDVSGHFREDAESWGPATASVCSSAGSEAGFVRRFD